jgi:hypothetical protein
LVFKEGQYYSFEGVFSWIFFNHPLDKKSAETQRHFPENGLFQSCYLQYIFIYLDDGQTVNETSLSSWVDQEKFPPFMYISDSNVNELAETGETIAQIVLFSNVAPTIYCMSITNSASC